MSDKEELAKKIVEQYKDEGVKRVKIGLTTIDGVLTGKLISFEKFKKISGSTSGYCDVVFGWDVMDELYDDPNLFTGWHTGFPDGKYALDLNTVRRLADEGNTPLFLGNLVQADGESLHSIDPRCILMKVLEKSKKMGYDVKLGYEYEFFVFNETSKSVREKNYQNLTYLTEDSFGYSMIRNSTLSKMFNDFMDYHEALDIPMEAVHCETGPGAWEAAIKYGDALTSADNAVLFKTFSKVFFEKRDMMACFMAKCSMKHMGSGGHVHQSLYDAETHKPLFYDADAYGNMSEKFKQFTAGQLKYMKQFLVLLAPTINSYTRLVKGAWAPIYPTWGIDNRTTALRVVPGSEKSLHLEYRVPGAEANPYLVAAALIASGMMGIEQKLELPQDIKGNAYDIQGDLSDDEIFPSNLKEAYQNFDGVPEANEWFGEDFVKHFVSSRNWEVREYEKHINDWQMKRYFEII
jgi:glutamine synthetase